MIEPPTTRIIGADGQEVMVVRWITRRVYKRCRQLNLHLLAMSKQLGVSRPRVSQIVHEEKISERQLRRISEILQVEYPAYWQEDVERKIDPLRYEKWLASARAKARRLAEAAEKEKRRK